MNIERENQKWRDLQARADTDIGREKIRSELKAELERMKRVLNTMHNKQERWNFIIDNTSDTRSGEWLCAKLIAWAGTTRTGIEKPVFEKIAMEMESDW